MRKYFYLIILLGLFASCTSVRTTTISGSPFAGKTVHKPLKKAITPRQANRVAFFYYNPYTRYGSTVVRTSTVWGTVKRQRYSPKRK